MVNWMWEPWCKITWLSHWFMWLLVVRPAHICDEQQKIKESKNDPTPADHSSTLCSWSRFFLESGDRWGEGSVQLWWQWCRSGWRGHRWEAPERWQIATGQEELMNRRLSQVGFIKHQREQKKNRREGCTLFHREKVRYISAETTTMKKLNDNVVLLAPIWSQIVNYNSIRCICATAVDISLNIKFCLINIS